MKSFLHFILFLALLSHKNHSVRAQNTHFKPNQEWPATDGQHINAHGGGILYENGVYYWYGEHRSINGFTTLEGVSLYTSTDLLNWQNEGIVLAVSHNHGSDIEKGCIMERPKVIYCPHTKEYVMAFHLELKERGYEAARVGFATSNSPKGPFTFIHSLRPNTNKWPKEFSSEDKETAKALDENDYKEWWTPQWRKAVEKGLLLNRDFKNGQMSRDMTLFVDDDGKAYHLFSSEENLTLHIAELDSTYLNYNGIYTRIAPGGQNEAPCLFKRDGVYWLITSGCTGWMPNEARMFSTTSIMGEWKAHKSPFVGENAHITFGGQGTHILHVKNEKEILIFMADVWNPQNLASSRHIWLPIEFTDVGVPIIKWRDRWNLTE